MESSGRKRRFPPPWKVFRVSESCFSVQDANGFTLVRVYCRDDLQKWTWGHEHLTSDEARRIASAIARIPEFMMPRAAFEPRGGGDRRWKPTRPYHVALEEMYARGRWHWIDAMCRLNGIPFNPTGEKIEREGLWTVYEFEHRIDAIMFWDEFNGRWLRYNEFFYPDKPNDLPKMKQIKGWSYGKPTR